MTIKIGTPITEDPESGGRKAAMQSLLDQVRSDLERIRSGGSESAVERHTSRGKLFVRDRIDRLIDPG